ncbi:MAG: hypothetical protein AB9873_16290 [Syntrophobacteraceae bacterium]
MAEGYYLFETWEGGRADFDPGFTEWLNEHYDRGYKYKDCTYQTDGDKRYAYCLFKRH